VRLDIAKVETPGPHCGFYVGYNGNSKVHCGVKDIMDAFVCARQLYLDDMASGEVRCSNYINPFIDMKKEILNNGSAERISRRNNGVVEEA